MSSLCALPVAPLWVVQIIADDIHSLLASTKRDGTCRHVSCGSPPGQSTSSSPHTTNLPEAWREFREESFDDRAAEMLLDGVAEWAGAEAGVEAALEQEEKYGFVEREIETFGAEQGEFAGDVEAGDFELHVVAGAVEDELFGDTGVEFSGRRERWALARTWRSIVVKDECWG